MKVYTDYFDSTKDLAYYLRPMSWFELEFDIQCKGKPSCSINIDGINLEQNLQFLNSGGRSSVKQDNAKNWKFSAKATNEVINKLWLENQGWDYYSQFVAAQPTFTLRAQCKANQGYDPISGKIISKSELQNTLIKYAATTLIMTVFWLQTISYGQLAYLKKFKDQSIELDDFSLFFHDFHTKDEEFEGNEHLLKASVVFHF